MRAHHGSVAREQRLEIEEELKAGQAAGARGDEQPRARDRHGRDRPRRPDRGAAVGRVGHAAHRSRRATRSASRASARSSRSTAATCVEAAVVVERMKAAAIEETRIPRNPLDVLAQQLVAICAYDRWTVDDLHRLVTRADSFRDLSREQLDGRARHAVGPLPVRRVRRPQAAGRLGPPDRRGRSAATTRASSRSRAAARSRTAACSASSCPATTPGAAAAGSASSTRRWSTSRGSGRRSCSAPRPGGSRRSGRTG